MNKKLFFLILFFSALLIKAQYLPLRIYTSADGLASNQVRDIKNDKNGALWIACGSGISYFTGFKFTTYGLKEGLPDITVLKIETTENGNTFILTYHGLAYKRCEEDYFKKIPIEGEIIDFAVKEKNKVNAEILVCIKNQGVFRYSPKKEQKEPWWVVKTNPYSIAILNEKVILCLENGELYSISLKNKKYNLITKLPGQARLKNSLKGSLFAITEKKVFHIKELSDNKYNVKTLYSSDDKTLFIFDATFSNDNNLWIGTNKYLIKKAKNNTSYYTTDNGLPELPVFAIFESHDGILWIGTNSGLAKLVNNDMVIYKKIEGKDIQSCISLYWDKERKEVWAGINRGVATIKGTKVTKLQNNYLKNYVVWDITKDNKGNYYFATEGGGVVKVTPDGKTTVFKKENNCLPDNRVTDLLFLNNTLYVATKNGFSLFKQGKWQVYTTANGLPSSYIRSLTFDEQGNVYMATYGAGIVAFKNGTFVQLIKNIRNEYSIIYSLNYKNGTFWATCNYGLVKVENRIATLYDSKYGFPNYSGVAVLPLDNYVWVGTDGGLCLFDIKKEKVIEIFTKDEGLPGNEFTTHNAICKDSNGNIWIGVFGGIAKINQQKVLTSRKSFNPKVHLKNITYKYGRHKWKILPRISYIEIPYGAKDITFNFDIIWFRNDYSTAIFYKLQGENEEWKRIENLKNTKVQFNLLSYGTYTLYLKITNLSGNNQSIVKKIITISVLKPWWARQWIILMIILLVLIGGGTLTLFFVYIRTQHLEQEKERLDRLVEEKTVQLKKANELLKEKNKKLAELAERDFLTGLYNRRHAIKVLKLYQKLADRDKNFKISFILIDIDFFKIINDTYGHDAGDFILKQLGILLRANTRKSDIIARWGGEEFLIILPKTNLEQAKTVAEKLRKTVEETEFKYNGEKIKFTISAGVAALDLGSAYSDKDIEKVLINVDKTRYEAKQKGRNLIVY